MVLNLEQTRMNQYSGDTGTDSEGKKGIPIVWRAKPAKRKNLTLRLYQEFYSKKVKRL